MATLYNDDPETREAWLMYAIEFARRGLEVGDGEIEVHGPHPGPGSDCIWGKADLWSRRGWIQGEFSTPSGCTGRWDIRGLRVRDRHGGTYRILKVAELSTELREFIASARKERDRLRREALGGRR